MHFAPSTNHLTDFIEGIYDKSMVICGDDMQITHKPR